MNVLAKARVLAEAGRYDSCGPRGCEVMILRGLGGIYNAKAEHRTCRLFKTLMTNNCVFDCKYCQNARVCNTSHNKVRYSPEELARLFHYLHTSLKVDGLFLSSGVDGDPDVTMERMIDAVHLLRTKYGFRGYVHLKVLPGTSYELIKRASEVATRLSVNIEAPNKAVLSELSSCKDYRIDILRRQAWISRFNLRGGQTTQMIVNDMVTDRAILKMLDWEYRKLKLKRVYFSAFKPVKGTPMEHERACPLQRQNNLYRVDYLLRVYGYKIEDFEHVMDEWGMLPVEDPKLAIARATLDTPIDINEASCEELIRIPGIGPVTAKRITEHRKISSYSELVRLGVRIDRARPFIELGGWRQSRLSEFKASPSSSGPL